MPAVVHRPAHRDPSVQVAVEAHTDRLAEAAPRADGFATAIVIAVEHLACIGC